MPAQSSSFLSHVAGLRGWAILLIVWFHLTGMGAAVPAWASLPYGYFGVEVFIVIMGYFLIAGFVRKGNVPLLPFAEGKFMRLLVPAAAVVLPVLVVSLFVVDCDELRIMSKTAAAALYGMANNQLIRSTSSYFATDSSLNPFLHFWYLSVAVQLFLLGYAGYFVLRRLPQRAVVSVLALAAVLSYAYSMAEPVRTALAAMGYPCPWKEGCVSYYATLPRLWELLAGGAVLLLPEVASRAKAGAAALFGFLLVLVPACCHSEAAQALTLPVVFGTMLLIRYGAAGVTGVLLGNRAALWLGGISTSVYLVHMPLLVLWKQWTFCALTLTVAVVLLLLSLVVGWGFYHAVEKRHFKRVPALALWGTALAAALILSSTHGLKKVWNTENNAIDLSEYPAYRVCKDASLAEGFDRTLLEHERGWLTMTFPTQRHPEEPDMTIPLVQLGTAGKPASFVLVGDSHAQAIYMGMDDACRRLDISGVFLASIVVPFRDRECPRLFTGYFYNREKAAALLHWLESHPEIETVVVAQYWTRMRGLKLDWDLNPVVPGIENNGPALRAFCEDMRAIGKKVVIWGPLPVFESGKMVSYARWLSRHGYELRSRHPEFICTRAAYEAEFGKMNELLEEMERDGLCRVLHPAEDCLFRRDEDSGEDICRAVENGHIYYRDKNHLSVAGSLHVAGQLEEQLRDCLSPNAAEKETADGE